MPEALKIQAPIEDAIIALLEAEDFITEDSTPVRAWRNVKKAEGAEFAIVHVHPPEPELKDKSGRAKTWKTVVELTAWAHVSASEDCGVALSEELAGWAQDLDVATINAKLVADGVAIEVDGPYPAKSEYNSFGDTIKGRVAAFELQVKRTT